MGERVEKIIITAEDHASGVASKVNRALDFSGSLQETARAAISTKNQYVAAFDSCYGSTVKMAAPLEEVAVKAVAANAGLKRLGSEPQGGLQQMADKMFSIQNIFKATFGANLVMGAIHQVKQFGAEALQASKAGRELEDTIRDIRSEAIKQSGGFIDAMVYGKGSIQERILQGLAASIAKEADAVNVETERMVKSWNMVEEAMHKAFPSGVDFEQSAIEEMTMEDVRFPAMFERMRLRAVAAASKTPPNLDMQSMAMAAAGGNAANFNPFVGFGGNTGFGRASMPVIDTAEKDALDQRLKLQEEYYTTMGMFEKDLQDQRTMSVNALFEQNLQMADSFGGLIASMIQGKEFDLSATMMWLAQTGAAYARQHSAALASEAAFHASKSAAFTAAAATSAINPVVSSQFAAAAAGERTAAAALGASSAAYAIAGTALSIAGNLGGALAGRNTGRGSGGSAYGGGRVGVPGGLSYRGGSSGGGEARTITHIIRVENEGLMSTQQVRNLMAQFARASGDNVRYA